jgi:hypothetical protein
MIAENLMMAYDEFLLSHFGSPVKASFVEAFAFLSGPRRRYDRSMNSYALSRIDQ